MGNKINHDNPGEPPKYPEIVYKYRSWNDLFHRTILTDLVVFMAPPSSFKDPLDCKLFKSYEGMPFEKSVKKHERGLIRYEPTLTRAQRRATARKRAKNMPDLKTINRRQEEYFEKFDQRFGVLSSTEKPALYEMWQGYAENGTGFCVGFDPNLLFDQFGGGGPVVYYDELPTITWRDSEIDEHHKQVFSKEQKWEFEHEYRTYKFYRTPASVEDRRMPVPAHAYLEVIFGWAMTTAQQNEIINICKAQQLDVTFKTAKLSENVTIEIEKR